MLAALVDYYKSIVTNSRVIQRGALALGLAAFFLTAPVFSATWTEDARFRGDSVPDPDVPFWRNQDWFGANVAIDGDTAVVGANADHPPGTTNRTSDQRGAAYIFERIQGEWRRTAKLLSDSGPEFGQEVDIDGDTIVVSQFDEADDMRQTVDGVVYVFEKIENEWVESARLTGDAEPGAFATSVAISGDTIVVGAQHDDVQGNDTGAAFIFVRDGSGWTRQSKIYQSDPDATFTGHHFGKAVAIEGDTIAVSAPNDNTIAYHSGAVYVFVRDTGGNWIETAKLLAPDTGEFDALGGAKIEISHDTILAASSAHDHQGDQSGAAFVFRRNECAWYLEAELLPFPSDGPDFPAWLPDSVAGFLSFLPTWRAELFAFGTGIALQGDLIIVGAFSANVEGPESGAAYLYERSGSEWNRLATISPEEAAVTQRFGFRTDLSGNSALISEAYNDYGAVRFLTLHDIDAAIPPADTGGCTEPREQ